VTPGRRDETDLLPVSLHGLGSWDERQLLRDIARLDETLTELGDYLIANGPTLPSSEVL
jgi:hypothetical protein